MLISSMLQDRWRGRWQSISLLFELGYVAHNYSIGIAVLEAISKTSSGLILYWEPGTSCSFTTVISPLSQYSAKVPHRSGALAAIGRLPCYVARPDIFTSAPKQFTTTPLILEFHPQILLTNLILIGIKHSVISHRAVANEAHSSR
jgi:hypothetical protein